MRPPGPPTPTLPMLRRLFPTVSLVALASAATAGELAIHVIRVDAGQGLAVFVEGPDGTRVLFDAGNNGDGDDSVVPYLTALSVTDLDYTILTHFDADHVGGMDEVMDAGFKPNVAAYDRGEFQRPNNSSVLDYLVAATGVRQTASIGLTIPLGDGAEIEVVGLNGDTLGGTTTLTGGETQFENASSIATIVRYRDFELYLAGDMTAGGNGTPNIESSLATTLGQVDVVIASHHGSFTSSSLAVVNSLDPSLVLYSAGLDNPFGHPDDRIVERWSTPLATRVQWCVSEGDTISATEAQGYSSVQGSIVLTTDGERFTAAGDDATEALLFTTHENPGLIPTVAAPSGPTSLSVSELHVDPAVATDTFGEWFELTNVSQRPVDLFGTRFSSGGTSFTLASRILLRQGETIVVGDDGKPYRNGGQFVHVGPSAGLMDLTDGSGSLTVYNGNNQAIETITWGAGGIATQAGASSARLDASAPAGASNFVLSTTPFAPASDDGSPGDLNPLDATPWAAGLWAPSPYVGGTSEFFLTSLQDPLKLHFLALSQSIMFPVPVFGQSWFLVPDGFFSAQIANNPTFFGQIELDGKKRLAINLPDDPALAGFQVFAQYLVLDFTPSVTGLRSSNFETLIIQQ